MKEEEFYREFDALVDLGEFDDAQKMLEAHTEEKPSEERSAPYSVELRFNDTIERDRATLKTEAAIAIPVLNSLSRRLRNARYRRKVGTSGFSGIRIVSEGDSWFQYPVRLRDIIDNVARDDDYAVYSLGAAGDTVAGMVRSSEYVEAIRRQQPEAFVLSAGGNDLLGDGRLAAVLKPYEPGASAQELIDRSALEANIAEIMSDYSTIVETALRAKPGLMIFGHGYAYAKPVEGGAWLGRPLADAGIPLELGEEIVQIIVDRFNGELNALQAALGPSFTPLDLRELVGDSSSSWYDELHPKNPGFKRVAEPFLNALEDVEPLRREGFVESLEISTETRDLSGSASRVESTGSLIVLDPGHGGSNPPGSVGGSSWNNAVGPNGTLEKTLTLDVALRARKILQDRGHQVAMTRTTDVNVGLAKRAGVAKSSRADVFISIHFNGSTGHNAQGTETFVHNNHSASSRRLCLDVQAQMVAALGLRDRNALHPGGIKKAEYGVLKRNRHAPNTACVLHEVSFLDRSDEESKLGSANYRDKIAKALVYGVESYLGSGGVEAAFASIDHDEIGDAIELAAVNQGLAVPAYLGMAEAVGLEGTIERGEISRIHVGGHMIADYDDGPYPGGHQHESSSVNTVVDDILASLAARKSPANTGGSSDIENDINEFSDGTVGNVIDFNQLGRDRTTDRYALESTFSGVESTGFSFPDFENYIQSLGLRHFQAAEFLVMGASNASGGSCSGKNTYPPKHKWQRIGNTARMLDEIRDQLGAPVRILSCYRSPAYNACINGASASLHMQFNAIDWRCDQGSVPDWLAVAKNVRASDSRFAGGIGRYNSFVHIDTRGSAVTW